jgi:amino acid permease
MAKGLLLGYSFVGFVCYLVMVALGEMAAFLPHKKGFAGYATRFVDPALGFALGWNYLMKYVHATFLCSSNALHNPCTFSLLSPPITSMPLVL